MSSVYGPLAANKARTRLVLLSLGALLIAAMIAAAVVFLWPLGVESGPRMAFDAGSESAFAPGSIRYLQPQHLYVVRRADGSFIALYDWDAWAQGRYKVGASYRETCRVQILPQSSIAYQGDLSAIHTRYGAEAGLEDIVLRSGCDGSSFDPLGRRATGPSAADLDRFPVSFDAARDVIVTLSQRECQALSPCLPYR